MFWKLTTAAVLAATLAATAAVPRWPDALVLGDGRTVRGLIIKNSAHEVILQQEFGEFAFPKSSIQRILDIPDLGIEFTEAGSRGTLPPWQVIANDLRLNDRIRSVVQIPAVEVKIGNFARVPYKSFRVNRDIELNIYGDPKNPAAVELGIYGAHRSNRKVQKTLRAYLAGFLTSRQEVGALYSIPLTGGEARTPTLTFEITPPSAPDAFGAWWVGVYNPRSIENARLSDADYEALTRPASEVIGRGGRVKKSAWTGGEISLARRDDHSQTSEYLPRGFYRDKQGKFRVIDDAKF
ncbi:MAG: hypothetical protein N2322_02170 [Terrimicrobiaceae bacterium]|nr:hypothetical protein [Terrimicrobiaceae bacterium]